MPAMLSCIRCNQILNKGEKFCPLCGGLGVVSQSARQMPEQKRDAAPLAQNEQSVITYWPWLAFFSLLYYLAALSISISLVIGHRIGLVRHRAAPIRWSARAEPFTNGDVILAISLAVLGFVLIYTALRIMVSSELKNASIGECKIAVILTTSLITFFIWFFLEIDSQTINRSITLTAGTSIFMAAFAMPKVQLPEDDFNN